MIAVIRKNGMVMVTNEKELQEDFEKSFLEQHDIKDKEVFFYEFVMQPCNILNGKIDYDDKTGKILFCYRDWNTTMTYDHIAWCVGENDSQHCLEHMGIFYTLLALMRCGAISKAEYEALHDAYCR